MKKPCHLITLRVAIFTSYQDFQVYMYVKHFSMSFLLVNTNQFSKDSFIVSYLVNRLPRHPHSESLVIPAAATIRAPPLRTHSSRTSTAQGRGQLAEARRNRCTPGRNRHQARTLIRCPTSIKVLVWIRTPYRSCQVRVIFNLMKRL